MPIGGDSRTVITWWNLRFAWTLIWVHVIALSTLSTELLTIYTLIFHYMMKLKILMSLSVINYNRSRFYRGCRLQKYDFITFLSGNDGPRISSNFDMIAYADFFCWDTTFYSQRLVENRSFSGPFDLLFI